MKKYKLIIGFYLPLLLLIVLYACKDSVLDEEPLASLSPEIVLNTKVGFDNYITSLHEGARQEFTFADNQVYYNFAMQVGTDVATTGDPQLTNFVDYRTSLTPTNITVAFYWDWAYKTVLPRANSIIVYGNKSDLSIWANEAERNAVIAEAKFFRAYTHNVLANLYGGVPIVDTIYSEAKTDFVRNTRQEVYDFAREDLEYAAKWLPITAKDGRIVRAAADHLLAEVYISLGQHDKAIEATTRVINGTDGDYRLMKDRFGADKAQPGDVFSDLFGDKNINRSSGNLETIMAYQIEDQTVGGQGGTGGNIWLRGWGSRYFAFKDPAGANGFVVCDSMGRSVGWVRPNNYFLYDLWKGNFKRDIRNSKYNIRRSFTYNNSASTYWGKVVPKLTNAADVDTMQFLYPTIRKIEGKVGKTTNNTYGKTFKDIPIMRLAETYLLRAEAYVRKGDLANAAADVNAVRSRANATPALQADMNLDYILDERARELTVEEQRRRTLTRFGKLVERVRKFNIREKRNPNIQDYHEFFPIPQSSIDANFSAKLEQNPGYSN